ncbi:MAG: ParB/RepB/Spo0J family partition protein [Desulfobacteraceae bacterium]|jgi:ParB family chromosome partitioning protein
MSDMKSSKGRKKQGLGRGLSALIPEPEMPVDGSADYFMCDIDLIEPNRYQPRRIFSDAELSDLSQSILEQGVIQPLIVRKADSGYELVAGERRLRASKMAGLESIPVVVRDLTDKEMLEMAIVENIQREDFTPMEEADAYQRLIDEFDLTQDQVASKVGKSRPAVANFLRLRQLPLHIKDSINKQEISMGHARALLGAENPSQQDKAWKIVIAKSLSVRETEGLIRRMKKALEEKKPAEHGTSEVYFSQLSEKLSRDFGTKVQINRKGRKGKVEIEFYSDSDLDRVLALLGKS